MRVIGNTEESIPLRETGKLYQDQLYRAKTLSPLAVAIIDTAEFQRLAGLRQLGFSDVVYRGAKHTRLEHSIGTYLICKQMMRRIVQNHERFGLPHPGSFISAKYSIFPHNSGLDPKTKSFQARWRGLMEVVGAAALLHDIGHIPFGHTLEDEFVGIFQRHDRLGGHRVYEMLFNQESELANVFTERSDWLDNLTNQELRQLVYLTLSWTEKIAPSPKHFRTILSEQIESSRQKTSAGDPELARLEQLQKWHSQFSSEDDPLFQPFMSDLVGNTICADLLDYLPRDRFNLGMEYQSHERVQRYFTIRPGTLHKSEGYRMSIMVTRIGHGGQRRDVASAVLQIMRERFGMAETVYYHHKKAAASAMLAKLAELYDDVDGSAKEDAKSPKVKPRDDKAVYPAPWKEEMSTGANSTPPHMLHLSDGDLIDYLGDPEHIRFKDANAETKARRLQRQLYLGLRYRRNLLYRTLLVIDRDLVNQSKYIVSSFVTMWRGEDGSPDNSGRRSIERKLAVAAGAGDGEVLLYCPSAKMQSKEIHARLEIEEHRIVPLSTLDSFVYVADVKTLTDNYRTLWRSYLFVSPKLFQDAKACRAVIERFCAEYGIKLNDAFDKVRGHRFKTTELPVQPQFALEEVPMLDIDEVFSHIRPLVPELADGEKRLRARFSKVVTRANSRPGADRIRIREGLASWARSRVGSSDRLSRADPKVIADQVEKIFTDVLGHDDESTAK